MKKWLPIIVFSLFGYYLVGANFQARLGMIDDHEIPLFLGSDGVIKLHEVPGVIASTEVGRWGTYQRFRPAYYTLRVIETALWRDNAKLWYGARYLMLVVSMYLLWLMISRFFPKIVSYLFVIYLMTMPFWIDLWTRLGPSEIYTVPAFLMFVYGMFTNQLWLITIGYAVAVGAKENFLFMLPILILYATLRIYQKKMTRKEVLVYLALLTYSIWIMTGIYLATSKTGTDVYGASVSYKERFLKIYQYKRYIIESKHLGLPLLVLVFGMFGLVFAILRKGVRKVQESPTTHHFVAALLVLGIIASQYLFYNTNFPTNTRYDFPVMIFFPIVQLIALRMVIFMLPKKIKAIAMPIVYLGLVVVLGYLVVTHRYDLIRQAAERNAQTTTSFASKLDKVTPTLKNNPQLPLVFRSQYYLDYEPIVSVARYLNDKGVLNPFVLEYENKNQDSDPLALDLTKRMQMVMRGEVDPDRVFGRFSPTNETLQPCLSVVFGKAQEDDVCQQLARF